MFTPTHLGPSLLFLAIKPKIFNSWALLLGSVVMDFENVFLVILNVLKDCPGCSHHGFFHSILGAIFGSLLLAFALAFVLNLVKHNKNGDSRQKLFFSSLLGWTLHILADSLVHLDVFLFWPLTINPFLVSWTLYWPLSWGLGILGLFSAIILLIRIVRSKQA